MTVEKIGFIAKSKSNAPSLASVKHHTIEIDGVKIFYREAGPPDAPPVLLPHGYPCSSYEFRNFMPPLADRWHLIAPDFRGCGYSDTPEGFAYDFDGYANFLDRLTERLGVRRFAIYLHDFYTLRRTEGSWKIVVAMIHDPDTILRSA
jgi:alpha-beta hydrolase superfamily lysophospholipase